MSKEKIRFALAGCGCVADLYLPVFKYLECAEIVAVIDVNRQLAQQLAEKYNVNKVYVDVSDVAADDDIDAVIIGTPPNLHAEHIEILAIEGKHILCEKPMASTVTDCQRIIDACRKHNVKLQLAHMKRFMRGNQKVKAIIDSGALGKIFMAECHWDCAVPQLIGTYREHEITGGGNLQDHGPHAFDLVRWWTGNDILEVSATVRIVHPKRPTEDAAVVTLEHENGMFSYHHMTRISYGREHSQDLYRIYGTAGTLVARNDHHFPTMSLESPEIILYRPGASDNRSKESRESNIGSVFSAHRFETFHGWNTDDQIRQNHPFYNQLLAFCECILNDTEPLVTGEDGMHTIEAALAAYVSSLKGVKIKLPFREQVNLTELFEAIKQRDANTLKYDYTVAEKTEPLPAIHEPILGHRPPRTKEKWSEEKHGLTGDVQYSGLSARLINMSG